MSLSKTIENGRGLTKSGGGREFFARNTVSNPSFTKAQIRHCYSVDSLCLRLRVAQVPRSPKILRFFVDNELRLRTDYLSVLSISQIWRFFCHRQYYSRTWYNIVFYRTLVHNCHKVQTEDYCNHFGDFIQAVDLSVLAPGSRSFFNTDRAGSLHWGRGYVRPCIGNIIP